MKPSLYNRKVILSPYLVFRTPELKGQYLSGKFHPGLYLKMNAAGFWHFENTGAQAVITSLWRQDGIHSCFRAADFRTRHIDPFLSEHWETWLNVTFKYYGKGGCQTALLHDVGLGNHLHLQVGPREPIPPIPDSYVVGKKED